MFPKDGDLAREGGNTSSFPRDTYLCQKSPPSGNKKAIKPDVQPDSVDSQLLDLTACSLDVAFPFSSHK
jgi:hypothetical protein